MPEEERMSRKGVYLAFVKYYDRDTKEGKELKMLDGYHNWEVIKVLIRAVGKGEWQIIVGWRILFSISLDMKTR